MLLLVFCLFLSPDPNRSESSSSLDSSLLAHCGVLGVTLRLRWCTRETDNDLRSGCACNEEDGVRTLFEGVRLYRLVGGATDEGFRTPFEVPFTLPLMFDCDGVR